MKLQLLYRFVKELLGSFFIFKKIDVFCQIGYNFFREFNFIILRIAKWR